MKEKKGLDSRGKVFGRIKRMAVTGILSMFLLTGCSRERMETRQENAPEYRVATPVEWQKRGFNHGNLADFYFQGQTVEELLAMMGRVEFHNSWLSMKQPLTSLLFEAGDWPVCEGGMLSGICGCMLHRRRNG